MTENITEMRDRHKRELNDLQTNCNHVNLSNWIPYMWSPGHFHDEVRICNTCDKVIERRYDVPNPTVTTTGG